MVERPKFPAGRSPAFWTIVPVLTTAAFLLSSAAQAQQVSLAGPPPADQAAAADVTYARDIAPILQRSCQQCHNPEGIGPMSLLTYEQVRPWAPLIKAKTERREMPPWHLDKSVGIQSYKNDISLSDEEIARIAAWVEAGSPEGNPADLPPPIQLPKGGEWQLASVFGRPPDLIVRSEPYTAKANSQDTWWQTEAPFTALDKPQWVQGTELKPAYPYGVKVVHHGHAQLNQVDAQGNRFSQPLGRQGVGKGGDVFGEGTGMLIRPGGTLSWNLHYTSWTQDVVDDVVEVGLWFYPEGYTPEFETLGEQRFEADLDEVPGYGAVPWAGDIVIPPHSIRLQQGQHVLKRAAIISSFRPHMHMRGREQSLEVIYPDGRKETLAKVDKYDHNWQVSYLFADHVRPILPKGSTLLITTVFDNTENNPINPAPDAWVVFGQRNVDEMSHTWLGMTYLTDEQYAQAIAEREATIEADDKGN